MNAPHEFRTPDGPDKPLGHGSPFLPPLRRGTLEDGSTMDDEEDDSLGFDLVDEPGVSTVEQEISPAERPHRPVSSAAGEPVPYTDDGSRRHPAAESGDGLIEILGDGRLRHWELVSKYTMIGRESRRLRINDRYASRRHAACVLLGMDRVLFRHPHSSNPVFVNGLNVEQSTLHRGDIIRIGQTVFVYLPGDCPPDSRPLKLLTNADRPSSPSSQPRGAAITLTEDDDDDMPAHARLDCDGRLLATMTDRPLLIGDHPLCGALVSGPGVMPLHAALSWTDRGLLLTRLAGVVLIDGRVVSRPTLVPAHCVITVASKALHCSVTGDPRGFAMSRQRVAAANRPEVFLTAVSGPHRSDSFEISNQASTVGRGRNCGMPLLLVPQIAPVQFSVERLDSEMNPVGNPAVSSMTILSETPETRVSGRSVSGECRLSLGNLIQFVQPDGHSVTTSLVVHRDPTIESWIRSDR